MKIGFVVNDIETEQPTFTTTRLALAAIGMGHEAWTLGVADLVYAPNGSIRALARSINSPKPESLEEYLKELQSDDARAETIDVGALDVLLLRNDPSEDKADRSWAQTPGILFGQLASRHGVIVLNDPVSLANAINKTYFQHFPEQVRPRTCISRNPEDIKRFIDEQDGQAVIKPLQGSGGAGVFLVRGDDPSNINQMIDAVLRDGYCIAQEYLPAAQEGDVRLFVMNGRPLRKNGHYAAFRRVNKTGDMRSNMHSGGEAEAVEIGRDALRLVELVRPKLVADGMFLVGLDIVGDKLMEINVFTPGGLGSAQAATGVDFAEVVVRDLERKVRCKRNYGSYLSNLQLATL
ncbi:MAG TPA: glutathione synthetase [Lacipirellulaceae bacterium]|nr:glutathione synthetase [Lacipirellulaceae bacterium]HMP08081.1 glutathione synthetase [Lacipirellulaceae bacterium]